MRIKCPYTYPHKSRKAKVEYICNIGGYSRHHDGRWPIEFNVSTRYADFGFDNIWEKYHKEYMPPTVNTPERVAAYHALARRLHKEHEEHMWGWGWEDAARTLRDDDTYRMLWDGTKLKVELGLHGRCGKHLVIESFDGRDFDGTSEDDLREQMMLQTLRNGDEVFEPHRLRKGAEWVYWTDEEVNVFYKYVRQCSVDFTEKKASAEVEYQGAFCFFCNIVNSEWETALVEMATHDETVVAAQRVAQAISFSESEGQGEGLLAAFITLCNSAGVSQEEVES